ncbi:hypothetical protein B0H34DRAFT_66877 [Crassisporium funariophilum]|nr:hypothetical protein B0H34DRAFT_66877 [Crassisporium funariophilum]
MTSIILSYPQHLDLQGLAETTSQSLALLTPWVLLGESTKNSAVRRVSAAATKYIAAIKLGVSAAYTGFAVTQNIMFLTKSDLMMDEKELQHYLVGMLERARKARGNANKAFEAFREVRQEIFVITQDLQTELQLFGEQDASDEGIIKTPYSLNLSKMIYLESASGLSSITNLPRDLQEAVEVLVLFSQSTSAFASWWDWVMIEADPQIKSKPVEFEFHIDSLRDKEVVKRWGELRLQYTAYVQMVGKIEDANPRLFPLSSSGILSNDLYQQPSRGQTEQAEQRKLACFLSEDNAHSSSAIVLATQESGSQTPKNYFKCLCQSPSGPNVAQPDAGALTTTSSSQLLMTSGARPDQHCTTLSGSTTVKESHAYSSLASGVATQENGSQAPNDFKCLYQSPSDPNAAQPDASALTTTSSSQLIMTSGARPDQHCTTLSGHTTMKGSHAHSSSASGVVTQENKSQTPKDFNCLYQSPSDPNAAQPDAIALTTTSSSQLIMTSGARPEQHCKTLSGSTTVKGSQRVAPTEPRGFLEGLVKAGWSIKKALEKHTHMWMADAGGDVVCPNPEQAHLTKQGLDQGARQHQSFDTMNVFTGPESYVGYSFPDGRPQIIPGRATTGDKRYVILCKDLSWSSYISASVGSVQILEEKKCLLMLHFQCHPSPTHRFYSLAIKCKFLPIRGMSV